jgi:hypothetical protein
MADPFLSDTGGASRPPPDGRISKLPRRQSPQPTFPESAEEDIDEDFEDFDDFEDSPHDGTQSLPPRHRLYGWVPPPEVRIKRRDSPEQFFVKWQKGKKKGKRLLRWPEDRLPFKLTDPATKRAMAELGIGPEDLQPPSEAVLLEFSRDADLRDIYRRRLLEQRDSLVQEIMERLEEGSNGAAPRKRLLQKGLLDRAQGGRDNERDAGADERLAKLIADREAAIREARLRQMQDGEHASKHKEKYRHDEEERRLRREHELRMELMERNMVREQLMKEIQKQTHDKLEDQFSRQRAAQARILAAEKENQGRRRPGKDQKDQLLQLERELEERDRELEILRQERAEQIQRERLTQIIEERERRKKAAEEQERIAKARESQEKERRRIERERNERTTREVATVGKRVEERGVQADPTREEIEEENERRREEEEDELRRAEEENERRREEQEREARARELEENERKRIERERNVGISTEVQVVERSVATQEKADDFNKERVSRMIAEERRRREGDNVGLNAKPRELDDREPRRVARDQTDVGETRLSQSERKLEEQDRRLVLLRQERADEFLKEQGARIIDEARKKKAAEDLERQKEWERVDKEKMIDYINRRNARQGVRASGLKDAIDPAELRGWVSRGEFEKVWNTITTDLLNA